MIATPGLARVLGVAALALAGCTGAPEAGPVEVVWDRDPCAHCYMTIGDRHAAAQVRLEPGGDAHLFDDLGCALLFIEAQAREDGQEPTADRGAQEFAELWVRDSSGQRWIDGRSAQYRRGRPTPMDYGFVADAGAAGVPLPEVWAAIREIEDERRRALR